MINNDETNHMKFQIQNALELARPGIRIQTSIKNQFFQKSKPRVFEEIE